MDPLTDASGIQWEISTLQGRIVGTTIYKIEVLGHSPLCDPPFR